MAQFSTKATLLMMTIVALETVRSVPISLTSSQDRSSEFRDPGYDYEYDKVSIVGDKPVRALEPYANSPNDDNARKEVDNFPSNVFSIYDNIQQKVKHVLEPKPILDNIKEADKYGNTGDQFYFFTKPLVKITQDFSLLTNRVLAAPQKLLKKVNKAVSNKLSDVGAGLVGL
ncbi:uncharacterized protein LOC129757868 [Uranotaenia lowii]|uniref:uncharacterized protein LOC129757868 n=1 Tax=Uranotaenia lowii TaxID=190385 RepID=UPI00247A8A7C|nr:uncharacterized protein LOC129757868 [Uranotaenia lowii]